MTMTILVIDDSLMIRKQVGTTLKAIGYAVVEAADGVEALQRLDQSPDTCLIVCDVNMPHMNGIEFLEQLNARGSVVPVVMLTTEGQPELITKAKTLGAKGWILKPFKPELLAAAVKKLASKPSA